MCFAILLPIQQQSHLQYSHAIRVAEDVLCLIVVAVADVGAGHKKTEGILLLRVQQTTLGHLLQLLHALLLVTAMQ